VRLREKDRPRPDTYRFTADLLAAADGALKEVRIARLAESIFYAEAVLEGGATVDARPSDAINLALLAGAPILVDETVLARAADSERELAEELARAIAQGPEDSPRTWRHSGRPNHSPRIASQTTPE
jgi:bifunctional DNase/RNase